MIIDEAEETIKTNPALRETTRIKEISLLIAFKKYAPPGCESNQTRAAA
jgi:hypothetical protein